MMVPKRWFNAWEFIDIVDVLLSMCSVHDDDGIDVLSCQHCQCNMIHGIQALIFVGMPRRMVSDS